MRYLILLLAITANAEPLSAVVDKLEAIESNGNTQAIGDNGKAIGCLQIWRIMVAECNRILKRDEFSDKDRLSRSRSRQMATVFLSYQRTRYFKRFGKYPTSAELASAWNTGSIFKQNTKYKNKYKEL
jgi:hypothetical protein